MCEKHLGGDKKRVLSLLLSRVLKSPFVSCSKMAVIGNKKMNVCCYLVYVAMLWCVYCTETH